MKDIAWMMFSDENVSHILATVGKFFAKCSEIERGVEPVSAASDNLA
jgi:hypothetical protein